MKIYQSFSSENVQDLEVKFSIYLHRRVFVMVVVSNVGIKRVVCILQGLIPLREARHWYCGDDFLLQL